MRKVPEIPFPISIWPHVLLQLLTFAIYKLLSQAYGLWPEVSMRLEAFVPSSRGFAGWYVPALIWLVVILLVGELVVRRIQVASATIFPNSRWAFRTLAGISVVIGLYLLFVLFETTWYWGGSDRLPMEWRQTSFYRQFLALLTKDFRVLLLFAAGEALRQWWYRTAISQWHEQGGKRRKGAFPAPED